jgi:hypothetical protein
MARRGDDVVRTCVTYQSRDQWWKSGAINTANPGRQAQWVQRGRSDAVQPGQQQRGRVAAKQRNGSISMCGGLGRAQRDVRRSA